MTSQNANENPLEALSNAMADAAARAGAWTVTVDARRRHPASGIAYGADLVLTADHVVEHDENIRVAVPGGEAFSAVVAGRDPGSDLALLRLDKPALTPAETFQGEARVGALVLALGRPSPDGLQASLGVISAAGGPVRTGRGGLLEHYLATDAIPYPGFSGGPLVEARGLVVGLNTSGLTRGSSLAIPASLAWRIAATLAEHGRIRRGYLGIRSQGVELQAAAQQALGRQQEIGLLVVWVEENGPAAQGGLMVGDILVGAGGAPLREHDELVGLLTGSLVGNPLQVEVLRGGQPVSLTLTAGEKENGARR